VSPWGTTLSAATEREVPDKTRFDWEDASATITVRLSVADTENVTEAVVASGLLPESPSKEVKVEYPEIPAPTIE